MTDETDKTLEDLGIVAVSKEAAIWIKEKERIQEHVRILKESLMIEEGFLEFIETKIKELE